ncbi:MAG: hypothetical protein RLZZ526_1317, partial [Actinomycetota bacterium]
ITGTRTERWAAPAGRPFCIPGVFSYGSTVSVAFMFE